MTIDYRDQEYRIAAVVFFIILIYIFLSWPIGGAYSDSDLWYHLSGGRYFFENGEIPSDAYFSFISPEKEWSNYYWLFQIVVYSIHAISGYYGLIILRASLYITTIFLIFRFFTQGSATKGLQKELGTVLFGLYAMAILPRELFLIRPHLFSYLFIVLGLLIIEQKKRSLWLLPVLYLAWGNLHGMEYPIALLIILAYLSELGLDLIRKQTPRFQFTAYQRIYLIVAVYLLFVTPAGFSLIKLPFDVSPFLNLAIREMVSVHFINYINLDFRTVSTTLRSLQNILVIINLIVCVYLIIQRKIRLSHLILFVGALILMLLNIRFIYEATLLTLPLMKSGLTCFASDQKKLGLIIKRTLLVTVGVISPLLLLIHFNTIKPNYPLSYQAYPFGTTTFLDKIDIGGNILNHNNSGGYVHWRLYPKYRIFMDLQMSIFEVDDLYTAALSKRDPVVMRRMIDTYKPAFMLVSHNNTAFQKALEKVEEYSYVPVFLDDSEILFADENQVPGIVEIHELKHVNPYKVLDMSYDTMHENQLEDILAELKRMYAIYPHTAVINTMISNVMLKLKKFDTIMGFPNNIINDHPENYIGYALKGQVFFALERYKEAIKYLDKAYQMPGGASDRALSENLHSAYFKIGKYGNAYDVMCNSMKIFHEETNYKDLYKLAVYAAAAGKRRPSETLLKFAASKAPSDDMDFMETLKKADFWE